MGFDFASKEERERIRERYKIFLKKLSIDDPEVDRFEHSWEFATHRYSSPDPDHPCAYLQTGKGFMVHKAMWRAALDIRPDSDGLRLWNKHLELKRQADSQPFKKINYGKWLNEFYSRLD